MTAFLSAMSEITAWILSELGLLATFVIAQPIFLLVICTGILGTIIWYFTVLRRA